MSARSVGWAGDLLLAGDDAAGRRSWRGWGSPTPPAPTSCWTTRRWPGWSTRFDDVFGDGVVDALGAVADPDLALLGLVRLMEALRRLRRRRGQHSVRELVAALRHRGPGQDRLLAVLGSSVALGDHLVAPPRALDARSPPRRGARAERAQDELVAAVGPRAGAASARRTTRCGSPTGASCSASPRGT